VAGIKKANVLGVVGSGQSRSPKDALALQAAWRLKGLPAF